MASSHLLRDDLTCPVCLSIFLDPVILMCSHSVCRDCLQHFWENRSTPNCPVCMRISSERQPPTNLALRNLCESYVQEEAQKSEVLCSAHGERLQLFCLDDKEPTCMECFTEAHRKYVLCHIAHVSQSYKIDIQEDLKSLQEKLNAFQAARLKCNQEAQYIKRQAEDTERKIQELFFSLHTFLWDEEKIRVAALKEEEEHKSKRVKEMSDRIDAALSSLSENVRVMKEALETEDLSFTQKYNDLKKRSQSTVQNPEVVPGVLIDVVQHLDNLKYKVLAKALEKIEYSPGTLKPNTSHPSTLFSGDLTSAERALCIGFQGIHFQEASEGRRGRAEPCSHRLFSAEQRDIWHQYR